MLVLLVGWLKCCPNALGVVRSATRATVNATVVIPVGMVALAGFDDSFVHWLFSFNLSMIALIKSVL